jgi:hypothetical protein
MTWVPLGEDGLRLILAGTLLGTLSALRLSAKRAREPFQRGVASPTGTDELYTIPLARWTPWKRAA